MSPPAAATATPPMAPAIIVFSAIAPDVNRARSSGVWNVAYGCRCICSGASDGADPERKSNVLRLTVGQPSRICGGSAWSAVSAGCDLSGHAHKVAFLRCFSRVRLGMFHGVRCEVPYRVYKFALLQALVRILDGVADPLNLSDTKRVDGLACLPSILNSFFDRLARVLDGLCHGVTKVVRRLFGGMADILDGRLDRCCQHRARPSRWRVTGILDGRLTGVADIVRGLLGRVAGILDGLRAGVNDVANGVADKSTTSANAGVETTSPAPTTSAGQLPPKLLYFAAMTPSKAKT